jgi:diguanylate cyclase (GGDEF)-like protein
VLTEKLQYEVDRVRRYAGELSVILCNLDNLKEINDRHGHLAGDLAIQLVAGTLRNSLRSADIAGRYGGDEFLVIVPQTPTGGAMNIAEKIRSAAERTEVRIEGDKRVAISLSMGHPGPWTLSSAASMPRCTTRRTPAGTRSPWLRRVLSDLRRCLGTVMPVKIPQS